MKYLFALCLFTLPAAAQTYQNFKLVNFDASHSAQLSFDVPSNTVFKVENVSSSDLDYDRLAAQYPDSTNWVPFSIVDNNYRNEYPKILGPAKIQFTAYSPDNTPQVLLGSFTVVNTITALQGLAVQPNGMTATVALESSPDLQNWQTASNGSYPATNSAFFYRLNFQVH